jgi:predicted glycoside hydrolase/deacetylase ChbG (UPF0249 family)
MKWLIVTADDFGITPGINRGILQAHREGILTSTSLMVDRAGAEEAAALGLAYPTLSIGLHLELDAVQPEHVPADLDRQLVRFIDLLGVPPTHADSHHDVHRRPAVLPHVLAWARGAGLWLRGYSAVRQMPKFYGQWGGETHPEQVSVDGLARLLDEEVGEGVTELTCHPGYVEPGFPSSYAVERELELATLCDRRARQVLGRREIRLIGFRDLPPILPYAAPLVPDLAS